MQATHRLVYIYWKVDSLSALLLLEGNSEHLPQRFGEVEYVDGSMVVAV